MAGLIGRQEARCKMMKLCQGLVDRYIPEDESKPMVDGRFEQWEDMAQQFEREITGGFLEALAQVSAAADLKEPGLCPHCQSGNVKWLDPYGQRERQSEHGPVVTPRQVARCRSCGRSFSPQEQAWGLDPQVNLTPRALRRVCREGVQEPFDIAARSINEDWGTHYDGKHIQRWAEHVGQEVAADLEAERKAYQKGRRPEATCPEEVELLVIGMDGGRVQSRRKNRKTQSRWVEDKVATISRYKKGNGQDLGPERLDTTYVATLARSRKFGELTRVEAERRGIRHAVEAVVIGDGAAWIDTEADRHYHCCARIVDYYHVSERLHECAKAVQPQDPQPLAEKLETDLYEGRRDRLLGWMGLQVQGVGPAKKSDPENHPRRVLAENLKYLQNHQQQMDYPRYRANGWPIGSGVTESGVKLFNKRVKGTEQFWSRSGVQAILALRALRLSQDGRWDDFMSRRHVPRRAA